jgi:hypothetical protein
MDHISQNQLLSIWTELIECYYEDNGYGKGTCEIYTFRYLEHSIIAVENPDSDISKEKFLVANKTLYDILKKFENDKECKIYIDAGMSTAGKRLGKWLLKDINSYRRHIQVKR